MHNAQGKGCEDTFWGPLGTGAGCAAGAGAESANEAGRGGVQAADAAPSLGETLLPPACSQQARTLLAFLQEGEEGQGWLTGGSGAGDSLC